jgi:elongation factor 1-beta
MVKLYTNGAGNVFAHGPLIVAELSNQQVEIVMKTNDEWKADKEHQKLNPTGKFPLLQFDNGSVMFESGAIAAHFGRNTHMGTGQFQTAQVEQWIHFCQAQVWSTMMPVIMPVLGHAVVPQKVFNGALTKLKSLCKLMDTHLKGKNYMVGDSVTVADVVLTTAFIPAFQTCLDAGFRKSMPNFAAWFARCTGNQSFINVVGIIKPIEKAMGAFDPDAKVGAPAAAAKDDDDMDLFGSDDDEDAAAAAKAAAEAAKSKKKKEKPPEMSLIIFEVKPLDDTTNLDDLAQKIFSQKRDGLIWKSGDYKKEPVAFGIFKLIVGMSCEDSKVSVDDVQEQIESLNDMVQSVEIASFTKI